MSGALKFWNPETEEWSVVGGSGGGATEIYSGTEPPDPRGDYLMWINPEDQAPAWPEPAMVKIAEQRLTAAGLIDLTDIPQTFRHLRLIVVGGTAGTAWTWLLARFNNDSTADAYYSQFLNAEVTAVNGNRQAANTGYIGMVSGGMTWRAMNTVDIGDYAASAPTPWTSTCGAVNGLPTTSMTTRVLSGVWNQNAAVNRLVIYGQMDSLGIGTVASLYGLT